MRELVPTQRIVRFYLHNNLRLRAQAGQHNFINRFSAVLKQHGFEVAFCDDSLSEQYLSKTREGHAVFLMAEPTNRRGVTIRLNYYYPFWNIETTAKRWEWPVAQANFSASEVPLLRARKFADTWRRKLFEGAADKTRKEGFVYVPLQGRLLTQRSFQTCSPIDMIESVLAHEKSRDVIATLHPNEKYTAQELRALHALGDTQPRLTISEAQMVPCLQHCDYVVTQNSSVALSGFFFQKPAVLFGRINFHHIASNVHDVGAKEAIQGACQSTPDFDAYLWWFLQKMSINAGRSDADAKIENALRSAGWDI